MKLTEVFAKPKGKIKWGFKSSTKWEGTFIVGDRVFVFTAGMGRADESMVHPVKLSAEEIENVWVIDFMQVKPTVSNDITGGGNYMYVESSTPNYPNIGPFILTSECFDFSNYTDPCFSFYTHMYGSNMGTMEVFVNGTSVWSLSGDQGNAWMYQQV